MSPQVSSNSTLNFSQFFHYIQPTSAYCFSTVVVPQAAVMNISQTGKRPAAITDRRGTGDEPELEPLVDEVEFSRITHRSVHSARRDRLLGRGCPYVKIGGLVRYRPADIRAFIERNLREVNQ